MLNGTLSVTLMDSHLKRKSNGTFSTGDETANKMKRVKSEYGARRLYRQAIVL